MAYHRHDIFDDHPGYEGHAPLEELKYNNATYLTGESADNAVYNTGAAKEEDKKDLSDFEKQVEEEQKKEQRNDKEEDIPRKAAQEINRVPLERKEHVQKQKNSIEEAIEDAIKEEKRVIQL